MKIAITGASGHLGANLVRILNNQGITPHVLVHENTQAFDDANVQKYEGNVLNIDSLKKCFADADIVYHMAAKISLGTKEYSLLNRINVEGTRNVVNACLSAHVKRLVAVSSVHAINPYFCSDLTDESCRLFHEKEGYPYERSKANAMREVDLGIQKGLNAIHILPAGLIGPYDFQKSHMGKFFLDLYFKKILLIVSGGFNFADIRDVSNGIITAALKAKCGERYILGGHYVKFSEIVKLVADITGIKTPNISIPSQIIRYISPLIKAYIYLCKKDGLRDAISPVTLDSLKNYPNIDYSKAVNELDYKIRPLHETIKDTYEWFYKTGKLKTYH